jgi:mannosyltransferase
MAAVSSLQRRGQVPYFLAAACCGLIALAFRLRELGTKPLSPDEAYSLDRAREPLARLWTTLAADQLPAFFALLGISHRLTGDAEWALRLPAVIAGASVSLCVWYIGRELHRPRTGLIAAVLVSVSPFTIYWSQEAKPEALEFALASWSTYALLHAWNHRTRRAWLVYAGLTLLGLYTFYYHVFIVLAHAIVVAGCARQKTARTSAKWWVATQVPALALFAIWPATHLLGRVDETGLFAPVRLTVTQFGLATLNGLLGGDPSTVATSLLRFSLTTLVGTFVCGLAIYAAAARGWSFDRALLVSSAVVPLIGAFALQLAVPGYQTRYSLAVLAPLSILASMGVEALWSSMLLSRIVVGVGAAALTAAWVSINGRMYQDPQYLHAGWRDAAEFYLQHRANGEILLPDPGWQASTFAYYLPRTSDLVADPEQPTDPLASCMPLARRNGVPGIWVALATYSAAPDTAGATLHGLAEPTPLELDNGEVRLQHYTFDAPQDSAATTSGDASGWGDFLLDGGAGTAQLKLPGASGTSSLCDSTGRDVDMTLRVSSDKMPSGGNQYAYVLARWSDAQTYYFLRIRFDDGGKTWTQFGLSINSRTELLGDEVQVPGPPSTGSPAPVWVRAQLTGASPTVLRAAAWHEGDPAPRDWLIDINNATPRLEQPGAIGLRAFVSGRAANLPVAVSFDGVQFTIGDSAD